MKAVGLSLLALGLVLVSHVAGQPQCVCLEELEAARGTRSPVFLRHAGDGTSRRFVGEQLGLVWLYRPDGSRADEPFLNLTEIVLVSESPRDERGFLSMAFHPDYRNNRRLYIYYSFEILGDNHSRISEILVNATDPDQIDPESERPLLDVYQPFPNHNGGDLQFGTDGLLYIFTGDGGAGGDPLDQSQDKTSFLGKALRVDVDSRTDDLEYGIPPDNPYLGEPGALRELYAIGLRNPWRVAMDPGDRNTGDGRGRIFIGDVGQSAWEEIDVLEAGGNYAWPAREGPACYREELCGNIGPEVWPIISYNHTHTGQSITSGYLYRGCMNPDMNGWLFFGDFMQGTIFRGIEQPAGSNTWVWEQIFTCEASECPEGTINTYVPDIQAWGIDEEGETYIVSTDFPQPTHPGGGVYKIVDPKNRQPPCPVF